MTVKKKHEPKIKGSTVLLRRECLRALIKLTGNNDAKMPSMQEVCNEIGRVVQPARVNKVLNELKDAGAYSERVVIHMKPEEIRA